MVAPVVPAKVFEKTFTASSGYYYDSSDSKHIKTRILESLPKNKPASYADVAICTSEECLGKSIALQAGFDIAQGSIVATSDG